jgi:hypothetical protein
MSFPHGVIVGAAATEAGGAGRIMHTQMDRVGLVLRTVARCPGRYSKTAERNVSGSYSGAYLIRQRDIR